ncbi:MAG: 2-hydroxychromene-2-carboxylate isomerase, partial [Halioglobus sp.]|nr:2-hydroxychromene-2-carboxylate isomerase [Halioglobus sp.]
MSDRFRDQGGAATSNPSRLFRWLTSRLMTRVSQRSTVEKRRARAERERKKNDAPHLVEYFHQVEDGYSHLAIQMLDALRQRYDIQIVCHLVSGPKGKNAPEPELLLNLSRYEATLIAPEYGLEFPGGEGAPAEALQREAQGILANLDDEQFITRGPQVSAALWRGDAAALAELAGSLGRASDAERDTRIAAGDERLAELKHYSGGMLYYGGEWYWGVDRMYHLEARLGQAGALQQSGRNELVPRPPIEARPLKDNGSLTLEVYPSLRSPYTAISFDRTVKLAADTGVKLVVRPVLPMVMRGVPATRQKGMYIFTDAAREARYAGVPYGNFYDPIGEPARRGYSLYPWACEQGRGTALISAFLSCAFAEGINTGTNKGLRTVVEAAGLSWEEAKKHLGDDTWEALLEENRQAMYEHGLWGVPSFRLVDETGQTRLAVWGQDR